jgi:hypothetical protein
LSWLLIPLGLSVSAAVKARTPGEPIMIPASPLSTMAALSIFSVSSSSALLVRGYSSPS